MRLTRRGWVVVGVTVLGTVMAATFGARSLNAVVFPSLVALVAALVQVHRVDPPTVERSLPPAGFPDEEGTVTLRFEADSPFTATVTDRLPSTIAGDARAEATVGRDSVSYAIRYRRRGVHTIGPVSVVARDVLGLATRRFVIEETDDVLVYPRVHDLSGRAQRDLLAAHDTAESPDRDEFDRLRQYVRGDSLRDVHWKSSAKREDLIVKEFSADNRSHALTVALSAERGFADEMADAAATVVVALLRAGVPVRLVTPDGTCAVTPGDRSRALEHLARVGHGSPAADDDLDPGVAIVATRGDTVVRVDDRELPFDQLVDTVVDRSQTDATEPRGGTAVDATREVAA